MTARGAFRPLGRMWLTLTFVVPVAAAAQDAIHAQPGQNVTLHTGYNFDGTVYVRMFDPQTGEPVTATFWSIKEFWNKDRGRHTGSAQFEVSGLRDELRAGGLDSEAVFYVTADGGVWQTVSNAAVEELCERFDLACAEKN